MKAPILVPSPPPHIPSRARSLARHQLLTDAHPRTNVFGGKHNPNNISDLENAIPDDAEAFFPVEEGDAASKILVGI